MSTLDSIINLTNAYIRKLIEIVQNTDVSHAQKMDAIGKEDIAAKGLGQGSPSVNPVDGGWISAGWPNYSDDSYHGGIDIAAPKGTPIVSGTYGTVVRVVNNVPDNSGSPGNPYGNHVIIEMSDGTRIIYAHMEQSGNPPNVGDKIKPGDRIGGVGNTGNSDGNHVHIEIRTPQNNYEHGSGKNPNPADYMPGLKP